MEEGAKVHVTLKPTSRFPNGKFYNGYIKEICNSNPAFAYVKFQDDVEGLIRLFPEDFDDIEEYREK